MNVFNSANTTLVSGTALAASMPMHQLAVFGDALDTLDIDMTVYGSNSSAAQLLVEQAMVTASHVI